jgi:phosphoribosylformylglycinamidine synthase
VLRIRGTRKGIALKTDCNGRYTWLEPGTGGRIAVAEAARNVACTGARPRAITNCLNFGNPRKPGVYFQLSEAIAGMGEACAALGTPVTGGNVSLYNESPAGAVYPTPVVGMVGVLDEIENATGSAFERVGDTILLLGETASELGGSEYLAVIHSTVAGRPPHCDLERERRAIDAVIECIAAGAVSSAHDLSDGGLAVALAECCVADRERMTGAEADFGELGTLASRDAFFSETQARFLISTDAPEKIEAVAAVHGVPVRRIGRVTDAQAGFTLRAGDRVIRCPVEALAAAWHDTIPSIMSASAVAPPMVEA